MGRVVLLLFFFSAYAFAYTPTVTSGGGRVRWAGPKLNLAGNPINSSGLSENDVYGAVVRSLQRWQSASGGGVSFDYWQGTDPATYEPNSNYNGLSSIYFASNANAPTGLTPNILGLTQVWYNTDSGRILEADTVLNDKNFVFTTNPTDTSGFGSSESTFSARNRVFVENVITHELGHSYGLSHSEQLQSTMLFMESPEQAHLGCDEQIAIHTLYPTGDQSSRSSISGTVLAPNGSPLLGANVEAISRRRGTVLASAMSDRSGHYEISGLEPGEYYLMAEPYYAGTGPLPAYYGAMTASVCPEGDSFGRTVLVDSSGYLAQPVQAPAGGSADAPAIKVGCNGGGAAITGAPTAGSSTSAPVIFNGLKDGTGFGATDRFTSGGTHYFHLSNVSGHLEVRALSYSLYSPVALRVALLDSTGQAVTGAQTQMPIYTGDSGYENYDSALIADGLALGDYYIEVSSSALNSLLYPTGPMSVDPVPFALITGTMNEGDPVMSSTIPFNARCRMTENFAAYQSPPGPPPRGSVEDQTSSGGCGMIEPRGGGSGSDGQSGGPGSPGAVGWFIPWLLMAAVARSAKSLARARSRS